MNYKCYNQFLIDCERMPYAPTGWTYYFLKFCVVIMFFSFPFRRAQYCAQSTTTLRTFVHNILNDRPQYCGQENQTEEKETIQRFQILWHRDFCLKTQRYFFKSKGSDFKGSGFHVQLNYISYTTQSSELNVSGFCIKSRYKKYI